MSKTSNGTPCLQLSCARSAIVLNFQLASLIRWLSRL